MSTAARRAVGGMRSHLLNRNLRSIRAVEQLPLSISRVSCATSYNFSQSNVGQTQLRCNTSSTSASGDKVPLEETTDAKKISHQVAKNESNPQFAAELRTKLSSVSKDLRTLGKDLKRIHTHYRSLAWALHGPYMVRTEPPNPHDTGQVIVKDNKVNVGKRRIPNIWLRDNCQCSSCVHDATKQRLLDTFSIPQDIAMTDATLEERQVRIEWSDGHQSAYEFDFLKQVAFPEENKAHIRQGISSVSLWDSSISSSPPTTVNDPNESIRPILQHLRKYGFCYVDNTPFDTPTATEDLLRRISFIRETHYGAFYDFTADLASKDTAYTNMPLAAHTDTTYFSDPAGLQAFHLLSHTNGSGGTSLLVDGFNAAHQLRQLDPTAYHVLATVNVHAHASGNDGISIQPYRGFPVLEHDPATGDLLRVRWNSADRAAVALPIEDVATWYDAARTFAALLHKRENEYWEQLRPGRVLIFDNWRVLHGRSGFTGKRRVCGGYVNRDDWISRFKMEEFGREKVVGSLAGG